MGKAGTYTYYGSTYLWLYELVLNTGKKYVPSAPADVFIHVGNGTNIIYVDPGHQLVMVVRWIENNAVDGIVKRVLEAMR